MIGSRRDFFKTALFSSGVLLFSSGKLFGAVSPVQTLAIVQNDLFPHADKIGMRTYEYFHIVLNHSRIDDDTKNFIRNGIQWLNEESITLYKQLYVKLPHEKRQEVLHSIAKQQWGENWIDTILGFIMEAVLGDPIYGSNIKKAGWEWLGFEAGIPRPVEPLL